MQTKNLACEAYDIVVYGGGLQAVAAAAKAANANSSAKVLVIVPYAVPQLGGIATSGGQNFWDVRSWRGKIMQKGTFSWLYSFGVGYNTDYLSTQLVESLAKYSNVKIRYSYDVIDYETQSSPFRLTSVIILPIARNTDGYLQWLDTDRIRIESTIFIDASEEGRIARSLNSSVSTGRADWPSSLVTAAERNPNRVGKQQAATIMFKLKGINPNVSSSDMSYSIDSRSGAYNVWGGRTAWTNNSTVRSFNSQYGPQGYMIKPINAAQNGKGVNEWWINGFLIFNVDGRSNERDKGTRFNPSYTLNGVKTTDEAWVQARNFLKNTPKFLTAMRQFDGFGNADFVYDDSGNPVVGEMLYLRETVHTPIDFGLTVNGSEDNYQITTNESHNAGSSPVTGADTGNYTSRIGLGFYNADIHPFEYSDLLNDAGNFIWATDSYRKMQPDLGISDLSPENPVYIPYRVLTTNYVANLLIPGYAASISSYAWGAMRVFANLCVMGDAAGIAAAYCIKNNVYPINLSSSAISQIQSQLIKIGAVLDKQVLPYDATKFSSLKIPFKQL